MPAFLGMRGTGDWATNEAPEDWRQGILYLNPNGGTVLTGMLSMLGSEVAEDYRYHWWTKVLPEQAADVTGVYKDSNLSSAYSGDNYSSGQVVYLKMAEADIPQFRVGHTVNIEVIDDYRYRTFGEITSTFSNGANSYISVRLLMDTDSTYDIDNGTVDFVEIAGNDNEQGAEMPQGVSYQPVEYENCTQIWRTPLRITNTARATKVRTKDTYMEMQREALELHALEIEKSILWGKKSVTTGANSEPKTTTDGIATVIVDAAANGNSTASAYHLDSDYSGKTWLQGGKDWLNAKLTDNYRWGSMEKFGLIGDYGFNALADLAEISADINLRPGTVSYGIKVIEWMLPNGGVLYLKQHPLFAQSSTHRRDLLILEPNRLKWRYIEGRDTHFIEDPQDKRNRNNSRDATEEEYLTEAGLEYHFPQTMAYLTGLGKDNNV